jgi:hypothetical protein
MYKHVRRGAVGLVAAGVATVAFAAPAQAANPYTPQEACNHQFGGTWSQVSDGHRSAVTLDTGAKWGDVYLMYNSATGYNCVVTLKTAYVGTASDTDAALSIQGETNLWMHEDKKSYKYYAATEGYAAGHCVQYQGWIANPAFTDDAAGARLTWGNCG